MCGGGGIRCEYSSATIEFTLVAENTSTRYGGGVKSEASIPVLNNCTISGNSATSSGYGGGLQGNCSGVNTILYGNTAMYGPEFWQGYVMLTYSCCSTPITGTGNITDNPLFTAPGNMGYELQEGSPCIDTGSPVSPLDPDSTRADMGAFFFPQFPLPGIEVSADSLDFFQVMVGDSSSLPLTIYNVGEADLVISSISLQLTEIFSHNWESQDSVITPGDSLTVEITFSPQEAIRYSDTLVIASNADSLQVFLKGTGIGTGIGGGCPAGALLDYAFYPPFPNPFNPETVLRFDLQEAQTVSLKIYNIYGEEIVTLIKGESLSGRQEIRWNAESVSGGIYFARLKAGKFVQTHKLLLLK